MKRYLCVVLALMLTGCGKQAPAEETTEAPAETAVPATTETTEAPTEPVPETAEGVALADWVPAILSFQNRGDKLDLVGKYDEEHFVIKTETGYGMVQKNLVRPEGEKPYETWTGYSAWNTGIYDNFNLSGDPVRKLGQNTKVEVLENLGNCYLVKLEDGLGFMKQNQLYKWPTTNSGGGTPAYGDDSGSSGNSYGQDGGDISMQWQGSIVPLAFLEQMGSVTGKAEVLADRTPIILGYFDRQETIPVVVGEESAEQKDGYRLLYWEGLYSYVQKNLTRMGSEPAYESWEGYAGNAPKCYRNFHLTGEPVPKVWTNLKVKVLCDLGDVYLVEVNQEIGYMAKDQVSENQLPAYTGGGDADTPGCENNGAPVQEWSDPKM